MYFVKKLKCLSEVALILPELVQKINNETNKYLHDKRVLELLWLKDNIIIITIHAVLNTVWNKSMFNTHIHLI